MVKLFSVLIAMLFLSILLTSPPIVGATDVCGTTIGPGGSVTLDMDQNCNTNPAITVMGPVNLNLDGHTVDCANDLQNGIRVIGTGAIVRNGVVRTCLNGMVVTGSQHQVRRMFATDNLGDGFTNLAPESEFKDNVAFANERDGFDNRRQGNHSTFNHNVAFLNDQFGFQNAGHHSEFTDNVAVKNGSSTSKTGGILNQPQGDNSEFTGNTATGNRIFGFQNRATLSIFTKNTAVNNRTGFDNLGDLSEFAKNTAVDHSTGIKIRGPITTVTENIVMSAEGTHQGIKAFPGIGVNSTIEDNLALGYEKYSLVDRNIACDNNLWKDNIFATSKVKGRIQDCID